MEYLGFSPCKADADIWMRKAKRADNTDYWEYVLLYVDDCLAILVNPESIVRDEIGKYFLMKEASIGEPDVYLGGKVRKVELETGELCWAFSSSQYVQEACRNVRAYLKQRNGDDKLQECKYHMPNKAPAPMSNKYRPEIDISPELNATDAAYYQSLIGIVRWMVELGRVDITTEVSMLSSCLALPREGHLKQLFRMFAYLEKQHNSEMVFDHTAPDIDYADFPKQDWKNTVYANERGDLKEEVPMNLPTPLGNGFTMRVFVDSDHAGDQVTRRSRTGFLVYLNNALIYWTSKKQTTVETSSFGSEFMAMKHATEYVESNGSTSG